jgi:hypothetical protein
MDDIERLKLQNENAGWKRACDLADQKISEMRTAASRMYDVLTSLLDVLEHEQGLSTAAEEAVRRCDIALGDVPLRLLGK